MEGQKVGGADDGRKLLITIDSGAAESVIAEEAAPSVPTKPSAGSKAGVEYINATPRTLSTSRSKLFERQRIRKTS